jgi:NitT/TauT family transport system permease protein
MARLTERVTWRALTILGIKWLRGVDLTRGKGRTLLQISPVLLILVIWGAVAAAMDMPRIYPSPVAVAEKFAGIIAGKSELGSSYSHIAVTLYRVFVAFGLSFIIGSVIGILVGRVKPLFDLFDNVAWIFISVPAILWAFVFVVAAGPTNIVPIGVLMALLAPKVAIIVAEGAKSTPADIVEMADSFKATTWQKVKDVYVPYLVPYLLAAARVSFNLGVKVVLVAEVVGLSAGVGFMVKYWSDEVYVGPIVAWGLVMVCVGLVGEYALFGWLERKVTKWRTHGVQTVQERRE